MPRAFNLRQLNLFPYVSLCLCGPNLLGRDAVVQHLVERDHQPAQFVFQVAADAVFDQRLAEEVTGFTHVLLSLAQALQPGPHLDARFAAGGAGVIIGELPAVLGGDPAASR